MSESRLTYIVCHEAWYWMRRNHITAEVMIQREALTDEGDHDGVHWEFCVRWIDLGSTPVAKLEMFSEAWVAIFEMPEVLGRLASLGEPATPAQVVAVLSEAGLTDTTARSDPDRQIASR